MGQSQDISSTQQPSHSNHSKSKLKHMKRKAVDLSEIMPILHLEKVEEMPPRSESIVDSLIDTEDDQHTDGLSDPDLTHPSNLGNEVANFLEVDHEEPGGGGARKSLPNSPEQTSKSDMKSEEKVKEPGAVTAVQSDDNSNNSDSSSLSEVTDKV